MPINLKKVWFNSITLWFNFLSILFVVVEEHAELLKSVLNEKEYTIVLILVSTINIFMRLNVNTTIKGIKKNE